MATLRSRFRRALRAYSTTGRKSSALGEFFFDDFGFGSDRTFSVGGPMDRYRRFDSMRNSGVMACLNWSIRNFKQAVPRMRREIKPGEFEDIPQHPLLDLLNQVNGIYGPAKMWTGLEASYHLDGNGYLIKIRNAGGYGLPSSVFYAPHWTMRPFWTPGSTVQIDYYEYVFEGTYLRILPQDVVHFRNLLDLYNPRFGRAPLRSARDEVITDEEAGRFTRALLVNMAIPGVVIAPDDPNISIKPEDAEDIKEKFVARFSGDSRGGVMVLADKMTVTPMGFTPEEMNLEDIRDVPIERIAGVLGIPLEVVGLGPGKDSSTYNNMMTFERLGFEQHLVPTWEEFAETINEQLLPDFEEDLAVEFYFDTTRVKALKDDADAKHKRAREDFAAGGITLNEYRAEINKPKDPDGDYYLRSRAIVPVDPKTAIQQALEQAQQLAQRQAQMSAPGQQQEGKPTIKALPAGRVRLLNPAPNERELKDDDSAENRIASRNEALLAEAFDDELFALGVEAAAEVASVGPTLLTASPSIAARVAESIGVQVVERRVETVVNPFKQMHDRVEKEIQNHIQRSLETERVSSPTTEIETRMFNSARVETIKADLKDQTVRAVREAITAHSEGESVDQVAKRVEQYVSGRQLYPGLYAKGKAAAIAEGKTEVEAEKAGEAAARGYRARLIAQTEVRNAVNYSVLEAITASGKGSGEVKVSDGPECGWMFHEDPDLADGTIRKISEAKRYLLAHPNCARSFELHVPAPAKEGGNSNGRR